VRLLTTLTLGYAVVLVGALAASLSAILIYLRRIGAVLGDVRAALIRVRDETAPLEEHLRTVNAAAAAPADRLVAARDTLKRADEHLGAIAERLGRPQDLGAADTAR
jgi:hypothetical protein